MADSKPSKLQPERKNFLDLPREIRDMIYRLGQPEDIEMGAAAKQPDTSKVCCLLRQESLDSFYGDRMYANSSFLCCYTY